MEIRSANIPPQILDGKLQTQAFLDRENILSEGNSCLNALSAFVLFFDNISLPVAFG